MNISSEIAVAIRPAHRSELDAINSIVEAAVMSWPLPREHRRLALNDAHYYQPIDLDEAVLLIAISAQRHVLGVAACGPADAGETPQCRNALMLDGPYVHPRHTHHGIGGQLLSEALVLARRQGRDGVLAKAPLGTGGFFFAHGLALLPDDNGQIRRYWMGFDQG